MARWDHGYVTDTVYTSQFHRETTPIWLSTAALLLGHRPPDLTEPFRYADLGCGNGLTAITVAATCPHAEVWGFDFNPAHIEAATSLAKRAGLTNAHFREASFADLAADPAAEPFDFMVSHGVLSWISAENQRHLIETIGRRLRPGGLAYVSYNVTTGMANMLAPRTLMRLMLEASPGRTDEAVAGIMDQLERIRVAGASYFQANPLVETRLNDIRKQDARYVVHEYLNQDWRPMMFADVADALAEAKCRFVGSATLAENIDATSVPAGLIPLLAEARDQRLRETLRDIGSSQAFRRDIYRRGVSPVLMAEQQGAIEALRFGWTGMPVGEQVTITTSVGTVTGRAELYKPLLARLESGPATVVDLAKGLGFAAVDVVQAMTLLMAGGYVHPLLPEALGTAALEGARRLNQAIAAVNSAGGDLPWLVAPALGTALSRDLLETLMVGALLDGTPQTVQDLAAEAQRRLARGGRSMMRDGVAVVDAGEASTLIEQSADSLMSRRFISYRMSGLLDRV